MLIVKNPYILDQKNTQVLGKWLEEKKGLAQTSLSNFKVGCMLENHNEDVCVYKYIYIYVRMYVCIK